MIDIILKWPSFKVDLNAIETWMKTNAGPNYAGNSSSSKKFTAHFSVEPGPTVRTAVEAYWNALTTASSEAVTYQAQSDRIATTKASQSSGIAKLKVLGLTDAEIASLVG